MKGAALMDPFEGAVSGTDIAIVAAIIIGVCLAVLYFAMLSQNDRPSRHQLGANLLNERAVIAEWDGADGYVRIGGELWRATSREALSPGDKVIVAGADGLVLEVRKA